MRSTTFRFVLFLIFGLVMFSACESVGRMREESHDVPIRGVETARVELDIGAGEMVVEGGARDLLEGYFRWNVRRWEPRVDYTVKNGKARVKVKQMKGPRLALGNAKNKWEISLNKDIPLDLYVDCGAGETRLNLRDLNLRSVIVDMGVGELRLDVSGRYTHDIDITVDGGIGSATVIFPRDIGVRVDVDGGLGSIDARDFNKRKSVYTNDAYGETDTRIKVKMDVGIGSLDLKLK
ncbi:toast rack family protein [Acidobacteriota bacterium]